MNERIKELAEQAGMFIVDDEFSTYGKFAEKFAELIVAECCVALHPMLRDMISRSQGVDLIVKHFRGEE